LGKNTNSASGSTNFLMSQGQATRSTLIFSRVIHFINYTPVLWQPGFGTRSLLPYFTARTQSLPALLPIALVKVSVFLFSKPVRHCRSSSTWRSSGLREDGIRNSVELVSIIL